jgi:hypothetical protein
MQEGGGRHGLSPRSGSDFDRENLAASIQAALGIDTMGTDCATISGIDGELRRLKGVGGPAVGAAAFGLFAFRVSHDEKNTVCPQIGGLAFVNRVKKTE